MCLFLTYVSTPFVSAKSDKSVQNLLEVSSRLLISPFYKLEYRILSFIVIIHHDILSNIPRLTQVPAARYYLQLTTSCGWFYPATDSNSSDWTQMLLTYTLIYQVNLRSFSAKCIIFMVCFLPPDFRYHWCRLWLLLQEPWRSLKRLEEAWKIF